MNFLRHFLAKKTQIFISQNFRFPFLDTRNIGMPSQAIIASGMYVAKRCDLESQLYVLAKSEFQDPRSALKMGKKLTDCAEGTINFILDRCPNSFKNFARAIENNEWTMDRVRYGGGEFGA